MKNPTHRSRRLGALGLAIAATLTLSACGSDSDSSDDSTAPTTVSSTTGGSSESTTPADDSTGDTDTGDTDTTDTTGDTDTTGTTGGGTASGDDIDKIVDYTVTGAAEAGFELDRDCVAAAAGQLSDADAALLVESIDSNGDDPQLSDEGETLGQTIFDNCINGSDDEALIEEVIAKVIAETPDIDEECVRENVPQLNDEQLNALLNAETDSTGPESTDPQLQNAAFFLLDCIEIAGPVDPTATT